jgi:hypothetical protein
VLLHVQVWKLGEVPGRSSEWVVGHGRERREGFTAAVAMAAGGDMQARARKKVKDRLGELERGE